MRIQTIVSFTDNQAAIDALTALGLAPATDDNQNLLPPLVRWINLGVDVTPEQTDKNGVNYQRLMVESALVDRVQAANLSALKVIWRGDSGKPEPTIEVNQYDIDGNVTGTREIPVGRFMGI